MNFPSVSNFSIAKGTGGTNPPEMYIPLWWYSGSNTNQTYTSAGLSFAVKGSTNGSSSSSNSQVKLHTLNNSWSSNLKYALEVAIMSSGGVGAYAELWDMTTNTGIPSSQINTTNSTYTVIRSGQFTLTPGHVYGVTFWSASSSYAYNVTDVSLIVFPQ